MTPRTTDVREETTAGIPDPPFNFTGSCLMNNHKSRKGKEIIRHTQIIQDINKNIKVAVMTSEPIVKKVRKQHNTRNHKDKPTKDEDIDAILAMDNQKRIKTLKTLCDFRGEVIADTGANVSATNDLRNIFNYYEYPTPIPVQTFENNENTLIEDMSARGAGYMCIQSDSGTTLNWPIVYTPSSNGTVLSPARARAPMHFVPEKSTN